MVHANMINDKPISQYQAEASWKPSPQLPLRGRKEETVNQVYFQAADIIDCEKVLGPALTGVILKHAACCLVGQHDTERPVLAAVLPRCAFKRQIIPH